MADDNNRNDEDAPIRRQSIHLYHGRQFCPMLEGPQVLSDHGPHWNMVQPVLQSRQESQESIRSDLERHERRSQAPL